MYSNIRRLALNHGNATERKEHRAVLIPPLPLTSYVTTNEPFKFSGSQLLDIQNKETEQAYTYLSTPGFKYSKYAEKSCYARVVSPTPRKIHSNFAHVGISGHSFFFFLRRTKGQCSFFCCSKHFQRQRLKRFALVENPCRPLSPPSLLTPLDPQDMDSMAAKAEVLSGLLCAGDRLPKVL